MCTQNLRLDNFMPSSGMQVKISLKGFRWCVMFCVWCEKLVFFIWWFLRLCDKMWLELAMSSSQNDMQIRMGGVMSNHSKWNKSWPILDNSILFEDLWSVETCPPTHQPNGDSHLQLKVACLVCLCACMHGPPTHTCWFQNDWNGITLELIGIIWFCFWIYDL